MKLNISKQWIEQWAKIEQDCIVTAGPSTDAQLLAEIECLKAQSSANASFQRSIRECRSGIGAAHPPEEPVTQDTSDGQFGQLINFRRRQFQWTLETLSARANIDLNELQSIESGTCHAVTPRTVYNLAQALKLPDQRLMVLAGLMKPRSTVERCEEVRFAARSRGTGSLTAEEERVLMRLIADFVQASE